MLYWHYGKSEHIKGGLARALETEEGSPVFSGGEAVLAGLRVEEIAALSRTWSQFNREALPPLCCSANTAVPWAAPSRASRLAALLVESISWYTTSSVLR